MSKIFEATSFEEQLTDAIEVLRADVQFTIEKVMRVKGISRSELAKRIGCSAPNVTQLLAEDGNPTLETIGKVFCALDDVCRFESEFLRSRELENAITGIFRKIEKERPKWSQAFEAIQVSMPETPHQVPWGQEGKHRSKLDEAYLLIAMNENYPGTLKKAS